MKKNTQKLPVNQIVCGNCVDVMKDFPDNSIDSVITGPPYDDIRAYNGYDFDYKKVMDQLYRIIRPGGVLVWVIGDATIKGRRTLTGARQSLYADSIGFWTHDEMVWQKPSFSFPSVNRCHRVHETMYVFSKGKPTTFNKITDRKNKSLCPFIKTPSSLTRRMKDGSIKLEPPGPNRLSYGEFGGRTSVWLMNTVSQENIGSHRNHPAQFPEALPDGHIKMWTNPGDLVLDPMCGSGTVCAIAKLNGRNYIGIDISKEYCDEARERVDNCVTKEQAA